MPSVISLSAISYTKPDGVRLFDRISLTFGTEKTGLVGRNGVGKTTLMRIIAGSLAPTTGSRDAAGTTAILEQDLAGMSWNRVVDAFHATNALDRIDRLMAGDGTVADAAAADWTLEDRIRTRLLSVGLPNLDPRTKVEHLSGGQRTRLAMAAALHENPSFVLLDEPTNNLDANGRAALIDVLKSLRIGCVSVSHDRNILAHMDRIVHLSERGATVYGGGWEFFAAERARERAAAAHDLADAEKRLHEIARRNQEAEERKARRDSRGKRSRARNDQPKIAMNTRRDTAERSGAKTALLQDRLRHDAATALNEARTRIERDRRLTAKPAGTGLAAGRTVLHIDQITGGPAPDCVTLRDFSLTITGPRRLAITGPNGSGKSTLLKLAAGRLSPLSGTIRRTSGLAMLGQDIEILDRRASLLGNLKRLNPELTENAARALLAAFLFRGESVMQSAGSLSGGEIMRAGLACVLGAAPAPELVILDEPTNHLDLEGIEAIEAALLGYDGALLVASHDDTFLNSIKIDETITMELNP